MKKVFLISAPFEEDFKIKSIRDHENSYSLGLAYLHSVIERAGYCIKTKNYNTADEDVAFADIKDNLLTFKPDYLLVRNASIRILHQVKNRFNQHPGKCCRYPAPPSLIILPVIRICRALNAGLSHPVIQAAGR